MGYVELDRPFATLGPMQETDVKDIRELCSRSRWPRPLHRDDFPLVLMWSPKAGCTTLLKWFLFQIGELDKASAYDRWVHNYRQDVLCRGSAYAAKTAMLLSERQRPVFKLVRDPWQRAVSSYLQMAQSHMFRPEDWPARTRTKLHVTNGDSPHRPTISFREFARALARRDVTQASINRHIAEQYSKGEENFAVKIIKLENFADEIRKVEQQFGLMTAPLEKLSQSYHHRGEKRAFFAGAADMQIDHMTFRMGDSPSHDSFYDDETRDLIAMAFRNDIERYGYGGT